MPIDKMVKEVTNLPDEYVAMVVSYIQVLQCKAADKPVKKRKLGILSDRFEYISEDFDEPLEEFKEYM